MATFFLLLGFGTVLASAFTAGLFSGRHWPGLWPSIGGTRSPAPSSPAKPPVGRTGLAGPAAPGMPPPGPQPVLTFYHELTAPLTAPPSAPKAKPAERPSRPDSARSERAAAPEGAHVGRVAAAGDDGESGTARAEAPSGERRFTVQAGAFRTRAQAEAIRIKLVAAGHDAYIAEAQGASGARYRVRSGIFGNRDEARRAARRVGAVLQLPTYVTIR